MILGRIKDNCGHVTGDIFKNNIKLDQNAYEQLMSILSILNSKISKDNIASISEKLHDLDV